MDWRALPLLLAVCWSLASAQDDANLKPHIELAGLTDDQVVRRIFQGEQNMIASLQSTKPLIETYIQSLWPYKPQSPVDDAYFLSTVDFSRDYEGTAGPGRRGFQSFLFGGSETSKKVTVANGLKWKVNPHGFLEMLFVDLEDFDGDTYDLRYEKREVWADTNCLIFSVVPKRKRMQGEFEGQIWVEASSLKIVRVMGTFTPAISRFQLKKVFGIGSVPLYFHFDSTRQKVAPDQWLPSYSYFDESRTWQQIDKNAQIDVHYRGHIFMWGYQNSNLTTGLDQDEEADSVIELSKKKLLAAPGVVENRLDQIVHRIVAQNNLSAPDIHCRVLLTTPVEMFSVAHTIILSRGLLNILPDDSIIPLLLAHEIWNILSERYAHDNPRSSWSEGIALTTRAGYAPNVNTASFLFTQLAQHSKQIPNLVHPRFGQSLLEIASGLPGLATANAPMASGPPLTLRGKYAIDSWSTGLQVRRDYEDVTAKAYLISAQATQPRINSQTAHA